QCLSALHLMQNPVPAPVENPAENPTLVQNATPAENPIPMQNQAPAPIPEDDFISFDENSSMHQPREVREPAVDLLTNDIPDIGSGSSSNTQEEQKKESILTIDELIKWLSKPEIKNNKKIRSKPIPKTDKEWFDLMESDDNKGSEPSDSEYDTADEDPNIYFEKIIDPYINRITEAEKLNEGEIVNVYKRELALKGELKIRIVLYAYMKKIKPETPEPIYKTFPFKHEIIEIIREDRINATIEKGYNEIIDQIEDEAIQESGWSFVRAEEVFLEISAFRPLRGSNYLPLPEALDKPQLGLINPQNNDDNECFKWCISAYHTRAEALKTNKKPPHLNEIRRLRRNGNIANFEEGEENLNDRKNPNDIPEGLRTHYVLITDFTRLMQKHIPTCPGPSKAPQRLILPEEDLEAEEIEVEKKDNEGNTVKVAEQKAISYGYTIHCSDGTTQKPVINRESENIIKDLLENLQEDLDVIKDKLCDPVPSGYTKIRVFDPETKKYLGASHRKCHGKRSIIKDEGKNRVIDHDHITGKFRGAMHSSCNLKLRIDPETIKIPVLFCNGSGYDFHHLMQEIAKVTDEKIVPIANNSEQYITFSVGQLQFIDSLKFSLPGLAKMAENLRDEKKGQTKTPEQLAKCFPIMSKFISPHLLSLLTRKGIFPYQWLNSKTKFNETQLPSQCEHEKIYTISQKDYDFAWIVWRETGCKTFGDYHDIYLKTDVLILADAFEAFRKASYSAFKLDPANYLTAPGLAWDAWT
ncbi:4083_t:CDS:2, partial [Ambispora gerdemannii]